MIKVAPPAIFSLAITLLLLFAGSSLADDREKLKAVSEHIRKLEQSLKNVTGQRDLLAEELRKTETEAARLNKNINQLKKQLKQLQRELDQLRRQQNQLQSDRRNQQQLIFTQINAAYRLGQEEPVKLLLNQEDPELVTRTFKYYDYFLQARAKKLSSYIATLQALAETELAISQKTERLSRQREQLTYDHQQLKQRQQKRQQVLGKLDRQIKTEQQQLAKLQRERTHLENVLKALEEAIEDIAMPSDSQPFTNQRGKLRWPVKGKLKHSYGSRRNANMKWEGWLLSANEGTSINTVHHGRVVFSDYLRGHGLLIIVDHGDGYMSLYAHNQVLLKEAGDWVSANEAIARVGNTGGRKDHALYFEIRHNGKPTNPKRWLNQG